jgi:seryl-tRNA synthetase
MLDRKYILENTDAVKQNCVNRGAAADVDRLVELENQRRAKLREVQELNRQANETSGKIKGAKSQEERQPIIDEGRRLREAKDAAQQEHDAIDAEILDIQRLIPNLSHADAPVGADDKANLELKKGKHEPRQFDFEPLDHVELGEKLDLIDFEAGARVTGHGFYFLKNEAVLLELALQRYALAILLGEGFTPTITPDLARDSILQGIGFIPRGPETQIYSVNDSDLSLVATAEITLGGMLSGMVLADEDLPQKYCGVSHCYRTEAGATARRRAGCTGCISSRRSRCSPSRCPTRAKRCSTTSAASSANCSMVWGSPIAWSIRRRATWAAPPIASSTSRPGCRAVATRASTAK